ncbi:hypothetical protein DSM112329_04764 [Paraconexibacter sp. AEG42_29]|uniref:Uncharacterized protein n=1 Tax=Paraconexibacter sp. AEG42_29 TaxID=2997339 RepID=A0AAU7B1J6_9ACTN
MHSGEPNRRGIGVGDFASFGCDWWLGKIAPELNSTTGAAVSDEVADKLDQLISIGERIADLLEEVRSEVSSVQGDVATIDLNAMSMKYDVEAIRTAVDSIDVAMP